MKIKRIEIEFAVPVTLTDSNMKEICLIISSIAKNNTPDGMVHWLFGFGNKPQFSKRDSLLLGKAVSPDAPVSGEPTYDSEVFFIETACREKD